jgi:hypothetical protein
MYAFLYIIHWPTKLKSVDTTKINIESIMNGFKIMNSSLVVDCTRHIHIFSGGLT